MRIVIPVPAARGDAPRPGEVFVMPDGLLFCGCGNDVGARGPGFIPCTRDGELLMTDIYVNGEDNPAWAEEGCYWCAGCGEIVVDARRLLFQTP